MRTYTGRQPNVAPVGRRKEYFQLLANAFRQPRAGPLGRDGDSQLVTAQNGWDNKVATRRHINNVDKLIALLSFLPDGLDQLRVGGRGDHDKRTCQVAHLVSFWQQREFTTLRHRL